MIDPKEWSLIDKLARKGELKAESIAKELSISKSLANKLIWAFNVGFTPIFLPERKFAKIDMKKLLSFLKRENRTVTDISDKFKLSTDEVIELIKYIGLLKYNVTLNDNTVILDRSFATGKLDLYNKGEREIRVGFVSDQHLGSHWERRDVLDAAYAHFHNKGINIVFNSGNWIEGEARFNKQDVKVHGMTPQINYCAANYPYYPEIKTYFVSGDDHEGWYAQREMFNIGDALQSARENLGRYDMKHLGYVEADIIITSKENGWDNDQMLRLAHPGGGSSYATSYAFQKIVESFQGGEKPAIYAGGHFHKAIYFQYRNVHIFGIPGMQDQSIFGRKQKIEFQVGFVDASFFINEAGLITSVTPRYHMYYDRGFYTKKTKFQRY